MLEPPDLPISAVQDCLQGAFGLAARSLAFLPIGADPNTAVFRAVAADGQAYFVKLRGGNFDQTSVALPSTLSQQGISEIIAPLRALDGRLWADLPPYKLILYPYIEGEDAYSVELSPGQWRALGAALRRIHTASLPRSLAERIRCEDYSPRNRELVLGCLERDIHLPHTDPVASAAAAFLRQHAAQVAALAARAGRLARVLQARAPEYVLCHTDLHAGNLHITPRGELYIVDWDDPLFAPRERDLMFIGGAQGFLGCTPQQEEDLFYAGYGPIQPDPQALAYYRSERVVVDIAVYCEQLLRSQAGGADREQSLLYLKSNFDPGGTIEAAYRPDIR